MPDSKEDGFWSYAYYDSNWNPIEPIPAAHKSFKECKAQIETFLKENKNPDGVTMCGIWIPTVDISWQGWLGNDQILKWIKENKPTEYYVFDLTGKVIYAPFILEPGLGSLQGIYSDIDDVMQTVEKNITKWAKTKNKVGKITLGKNDDYILYDSYCAVDTVKKWLTDVLNKSIKNTPKTATKAAIEAANKVFDFPSSGWPMCPNNCDTLLYECKSNCHYTNDEDNGFEQHEVCPKEGMWICTKCQIHWTDASLKEKSLGAPTIPFTNLQLVEKPKEKGEPMARNFWIEVEVDGKKIGFRSGPKAADGGFSMKVFQRDNGNKVQVLDVSGTSNGKQTTLATQVTSENQPIFKIKTKR